MDASTLENQPALQPATQDNTLEIPSRQQSRVSPYDLMRAIVAQESGGNPNARGKAGEIGLMQITPAVGRQYGIEPSRLSDPSVNLMVGQRYLNDLWKQFGGNLNLVLTAWNAGPSRAKKGEVPASTKKYISQVWNRLANLSMGGTAEAADLPPMLSGAKEVPSPWKSAGTGMKEVADPWQTKTTPESLYERGRSAVLPTVAKAFSEFDPRHRMLEQNASTGQLQTAPPNALGTKAADLVVPPTLTGAGVQAGLMGTGLGEMGLLSRLVLPTVGGAAGAYLEGKDPLVGAATGGASAVGGEFAGAATGIAGRALLKGRVARDLGRSVGDSLGGFNQRIGVRPAPDMATFERMYSLGGLTNQAGRKAEQASTRANTMLGGRRLSVGSLGPPMRLPEIEDTIEALNEGVYLPSGQMRAIQGRGPMVRAAYQLREGTAQQLDAIAPGLGKLWRQSRKDAAAAKTLQDLFDPSNEVFEHGGLNQPNLEKLVTGKYWERLNRTLGPEDTQKLLQAVRRFGKGPAARDIPGRELHGRIGMSLEPHFGFPRTYKPVGQVPAIMNRAGTNPMRIPAGMTANDILQWFNAPIGGEVGAAQ